MIRGCILLIAVLAGSTSAQDDFVTLFNGQDLSGWSHVGTPGAFVVKAGAIYSTGAKPYPSWLRTEEQYENFILHFEYRTEGWYEGGVLFHAPLEGPGSKLGFKLHLRHDSKAYGARSPGAIYDV
ncbi:MAG: 3-keto-disaccharide hydrolase, partial [Planctomycetota bacterium]